MRRILVITVIMLFCACIFPAVAEPLKVCLVSGSFEYDSDTALARFKEYLEQYYEADCTLLKADGWTNIPGLEALDTCDTALFYTRRLELEGWQLDLIKRYCDAGKPLVAVRTASHGFQKWLAFDREVLGGNYKGHFGEGPTVETFMMPSGKGHPILDGVGNIRSRYSLYRTAPVARDATVLLTGGTPDSMGRQPLAWTREHKGGRVFYSSLGGVEDFEHRAFARMAANALFWTANRPVARREPPALESRMKKEGMLRLAMRTRVPAGTDGEDWREESILQEWRAHETAIIVCDMWDRHWCDFATARVDEMAPRMNELLTAARGAGVMVVHCPSETLGFYQDTPARRRMLSPTPVIPEILREVAEPPLPIDDSDGGCPGPEKFYPAWSRQHPAIEIMDGDGISDDGREIYSHFRQEGIRNIIYMGVHTNMCVLGRSFGIRQMSRWGMNCALVRDLTDTMYNPAMPPNVAHDEGTELVVQHIEKYWCPSLLAEELNSGLPDTGN